MFSSLKAKILGFYTIQELKEDEDFQEIAANPRDHESYTLQDGCLFKHNKLCVPRSSLRELVVREVHGALEGYFGINKTIEILREYFYSFISLGLQAK